MEDNKSLHVLLGQLLAKQDMTLQMLAEHRKETASELAALGQRITTLEHWRTRATAYVVAASAAFSLLWQVFPTALGYLKGSN